MYLEPANINIDYANVIKFEYLTSNSTQREKTQKAQKDQKTYKHIEENNYHVIMCEIQFCSSFEFF